MESGGKQTFGTVTDGKHARERIGHSKRQENIVRSPGVWAGPYPDRAGQQQGHDAADGKNVPDEAGHDES
jgi:hypothetical protein